MTYKFKNYPSQRSNAIVKVTYTKQDIYSTCFLVCLSRIAKIVFYLTLQLKTRMAFIFFLRIFQLTQPTIVDRLTLQGATFVNLILLIFLWAFQTRVKQISIENFLANGKEKIVKVNKSVKKRFMKLTNFF